MKQTIKLIDLNKIHRVHFVGIKGVGMAAMAVWAKEKGWQVSGSDKEEEFPTDELLTRYAIAWKEGFKRENLPKDIDLVVATGAHGGKTNIEAVSAAAKGIPLMMQGETLGFISKEKKTISVAGSHGKTTTAALVAHLLIKTGLDPSFVVGCGFINSLSTPAHHGAGQYFIVEADEYINCPITDRTPKFLFLNPSISVITNIEFDHPDAYESLAAVERSFLAFAKKTEDQGCLITCIDNPSVRRLIKKLKLKSIITYGFSPQADFQAYRLTFGDGKTCFWVKHRGRSLGQFELKVPGRHNALNAIAAGIVANQLGMAWPEIGVHLLSFTGAKRRFELIKTSDDIALYDDYAHHPSEIKATLKAARSWFGKKRIIAIFQPHTYSRTRALFADFVRAFGDADITVICEIYPSAREKVDSTISAKQLVEAMDNLHLQAVYRPNKASVIDYLDKEIRSGDVIFTLGAGSIYSWLPDLKRLLKK